MPGGPSVVTVGSFDGVHQGHWAVLEEIVRRAGATGRRSLLVTFDPHPLEVVNPDAAPALLTTAEEKREILAQSGLDAVVFVRFTRALAEMSPTTFVREILRRRFAMQELVIGYDHGFGRGRAGDVGLLQQMAAEDGFSVDVVDAVDVGARAVSSTIVRRAIAGGDLEHARRWLNRRYSLTGRVIEGAGRGRSLGVPTINVKIPHPRKLLPPDGVYAAVVEWRGGRRGGMLNQGPRPTFGEHDRHLEVHLFDFDGTLYGERVTVEWVRRLRDIRSFSRPEGLRAQLDEDAKAARDTLTQTSVLN